MSRFARDERGATVVEYGLIAALVFLAIVGAVTAFSENTKAMFDMIAEKIARPQNLWISTASSFCVKCFFVRAPA